MGTVEVRDYPNYDANGNLKGFTASTASGAYLYDALDRLVTESLSASHSFGYDANGNRNNDNGTAYIYAPAPIASVASAG